ncbi:MAG: lysophospholipid acyltransferase family protein [Flavobacteriaceae bacterium]
MKKLFYNLILLVFKNYNHFYFKRFKVYGLDNIPKSGGVIFSPNHQGAFLDPLIVGTTCGFEVTSLTRSDVFGGTFQWFLDALKMLPVYRIRDGFGSLKKNQQTFNQCYELLANGKKMMMFSEGGHHNEYYLQRLSKGSSRLALEAQEKSKNSKIYLVPVGINYSHHQLPWQEVHVVYGKPIKVSEFLKSYHNNIKTVNLLRDTLEVEMKSCLWLPENNENYLEKKKYINLHNTKLGFHELRKKLDLSAKDLKTFQRKVRFAKFWIKLLGIPNLFPLFALRRVLSFFPDIVFQNSVKYSVGLFIFIFWWFILFFSGVYFYDISVGISLVIGSLSLLYLRQEIISMCFHNK